MLLYGGLLLLIIALILGGVQHFTDYNLYGAQDNKWYFWGLVGIIGIVGIVLAAWSFMKKPATPAPAEKPAQ
jgi:hypothetical protein